MTYEEPLMIVKISVSFVGGYSVEDVVYYQYKLPLHLTIKYTWYFEYLAALVKVHNPRRHVELHIGRQDDKTGNDLILCGQDYIDAKTPSLIAGKKRTIAKLRNRMPADDLFGLGKAECEAKIAGIQAEIDALECGEFNYYVPATYINKIKQYISNEQRTVSRFLQ